ncbi:dihydrolipoyl dehydrogenase family protein [Planctomicrobium sp. SH661]|uniref:dihydrolipoyl dehydrogenase family protein n=1 Tax=Planctomicrobium sp. SH661 TaxID=3448124 RepID=UPI003F5C89CD
MPRKFGLICLGTGPAASTVATTCAKEGWDVAVVESREFGGTCALRGCNPKKVFSNAAALVGQMQQALGRLARGNQIRIEWSDLVRFQHEFTAPVREQTEDKLRKRKIATFHGLAQFESERVIRVGEDLLQADFIFIGVGANPVPLQIPGEEFVVTSDEFMERRTLPDRVLFLGGGYISFEFAHAAARAGAAATIVDRHPLPLKSFDPDLVELLVKCSQDASIEVLTNSEAKSIERKGGQLQVMLKSPAGERTVSTDMVVHGGGRVPNLNGLNLPAGDIAVGKQGIAVNEFLQSTTNPTVFAAGDCADTGVPKLTTTAEASARVAASNLLRSRSLTSDKTSSSEHNNRLQKVKYGPVPQVVFSVPPLAAVGLSEADARNQGFELDVRFQDLSTKGEVRKLCSPAAACKVIVDRRSDRILGAHILGPHAEEVINLFALAIHSHTTSAQLKSMLLAYPTMTAEYLRVL